MYMTLIAYLIAVMVYILNAFAFVKVPVTGSFCAKLYNLTFEVILMLSYFATCVSDVYYFSH